MLRQETFQHVGHQSPTRDDVDDIASHGTARRVHAGFSKLLSAAQELAIDVADRFENVLNSPVILQILGHLLLIRLRDVLHLRSHARPADRQVVLGTVPRTLSTPAARLPAWLVAFDERASKDRLQGGKLAQ